MNDQLKLGDPKSGLSSLFRPHFTEGLLLQDDDLTAGVNYTRELSRLMFRTMFGCGVLCGLKVDAPFSECGKLKVKVARGIALDCLGDPIEMLKPQVLEIDTCKTTVGLELWVGLKHVEKCCAPRTTACPADDDAAAVCTRERDGFELRLFSARPPCSCGCAALAPVPTPVVPQEVQPAAADAVDAVAAPAATPAATAAPAVATECGCGTATEPAPETSPEPAAPCQCNTRTDSSACYGKFYNGDCACECSECEWIVLAKIRRTNTETAPWVVDHSVRRFVRPVLMRDPLVAFERQTPAAP
jgi:hypothetical protein